MAIHGLYLSGLNVLMHTTQPGKVEYQSAILNIDNPASASFDNGMTVDHINLMLS